MAVRNSNLQSGASDWFAGNVLKAVDLNDTFTASFYNPNFWVTLKYGLPTPSYVSDSLSSYSGLIWNDDQDEYSGTGVVSAVQNLSSDYLRTYNKFAGCFRYYIYGLVDECNNSSIDGAIWDKVTSTGNTEVYSENAVKLSFTENSSHDNAVSVCDLRCKTDFYNTGKTVLVKTLVSSAEHSSAGGGYAYARLRITDYSGNFVNVDYVDDIRGTSGDAGASIDGVYTLKFSGTSGVYAWKDGVALNSGSIISLAGLTGNVWKLDFYAAAACTNTDFGNSSSAAVYVWYVRTVPSVILSTAPVLSFCSDGSSYVTATSNFAVCSSLGNSNKMRLAGTINAVEVLVLCSGSGNLLGCDNAGVY